MGEGNPNSEVRGWIFALFLAGGMLINFVELPLVQGESQVAAEAGPRLVFEREVFNFGQVMTGEVVNHDFQFTNGGKQELKILEIRPACGCTQAGEGKRSIAPGGSGRIPISLNTRGMRGEVRKVIQIITNVPENPNYKVWLEGRVQEPFEISHRNVNFGVINPEQNPRKTVTIINRQKHPMFISNVLCQNPGFVSCLKVIKAGREFELIVEAKPGLSPGGHSGEVEMQAWLPESVKIWIPVSGYVPPPVDIRPRRIIMRAGTLPVVMRKIISVRYTRSGFLKISDLTINRPEVKLELVEKIPIRPDGYSGRRGVIKDDIKR